ncbi:thyroid receptor-interacting protein 6-like [Myxocyprinus asiaticus]|uniref:thyroid receptor-interacting protein 6-like n=1 Tax=Myxocyprinus asiaticus TaxID=70543 RepID=UPI00222363A8|nr:thyroid receptor-interacting protein 6-like [Myxocyprinus asiaticus]XP_051510145.1 thyroid receptor-interacting protein 6-like [Myxocyprinus asiaticus]XP_051510155.1 thyroid receptor-interacting protein 6-like [Myxocyprinus asiaticus]XP_051510165.1 thyroid receptor-interacting protein 6-like [Myxocyprinus asiaticus]XP_051510174.1 thyroid receptor-interacting protein 6-like [Myxocyprinus asiaticus]XP_051510183.1 thyroid receptor-interacting protein 6-like [Myxocyprinus asiaticus]
MSGPTWLPPRTLGSPDRATAAMSHTGPALYRPPKKVLPDQRSKYSMYDQNGGPGGNSMPVRYMATGPSGGNMQHQHQDDRSGSSAYRPLSPNMGERYYTPGQGPKEDHQTWSPHMASHEIHNRGSEKHVSTIDAEIDSLTCMLADLDSHPQNSSTQLYDNVPYSNHLPIDRYKPPNQMVAPPPIRPSMGYPPPLQSQYHPSPPYTSTPQADYAYSPSSSIHKPYPQPVPASYTTASTPTGPRFTVQVKTAQPVTYSQGGRQAEQAYAPSAPRQHASRPPQQDRPYYEPQGQGWYPPPPAQEPHGDPAAYKGGSGNMPGGRVGQGPTAKKSQDQSAYEHNKVSAHRPEEELDRLTKKLVYDMNHPPTEEYFGRCARCGDNVLGDGSGCIAMEQVFHVECFTCITCHARLRGQPFYALDRKSYCESCYISTLEHCSKCSEPILDRILRAMGKAYHPRCFTCVVCGCCLDGVPFTVDAASQIHCIKDFHRKFAPRCSVCCQPIMPEPGQEETVRIVALDRSFHVNCYVCEECGLLLSSEGEGRGCYPLDGHILCKSCSARRIQDLSAKISTDC